MAPSRRNMQRAITPSCYLSRSRKGTPQGSGLPPYPWNWRWSDAVGVPVVTLDQDRIALARLLKTMAHKTKEIGWANGNLQDPERSEEHTSELQSLRHLV